MSLPAARHPPCMDVANKHRFAKDGSRDLQIRFGNQETTGNEMEDRI